MLIYRHASHLVEPHAVGKECLHLIAILSWHDKAQSLAKGSYPHAMLGIGSHTEHVSVLKVESFGSIDSLATGAYPGFTIRHLDYAVNIRVEMALVQNLAHVGTIVVKTSLTGSHHDCAIIHLLHHSNDIRKVHIALAIGINPFHTLVHHLDVRHASVFRAYPHSIVTVGYNAEKIVGGDRRLSQLVCHEMLALGQVLVEHEKSFAISGNPDEPMIVLYDMESLMVDVIGGLLWEENQGHKLVLSYQAQLARLVIYPLSAFVICQHPAIGDKPFALTLRNLSCTYVDRE